MAPRGVLLAALAGGLVSSTAVALSNARRAASSEGAPRLLAAGVSVATAVSFIRVIAIVAVIQPVLLGLIAPALVAATLVAVLHALASVYWRSDGERSDEPPPAEFGNPFSSWPVVGFAIFLGIAIVLGHAIGQAFGARGSLFGAAGLGLADVDAITISMARLVPAPLSQLGATEAILAAVASNMVSKLAIAAGIGRGVAVMTVACWLAALAALWAALALAGS
jgi:uncharacterized membrane protein (DUF4010 family)